jgi:hypothetical protein
MTGLALGLIAASAAGTHYANAEGETHNSERLYSTSKEAMAVVPPPPGQCIESNGHNRCTFGSVQQSSGLWKSGWYHCLTEKDEPISCDEKGALVDVPGPVQIPPLAVPRSNSLDKAVCADGATESLSNGPPFCSSHGGVKGMAAK